MNLHARSGSIEIVNGALRSILRDGMQDSSIKKEKKTKLKRNKKNTEATRRG